MEPGRKAAMIYKFAQQVEWKNEEAIDTFLLGVYGTESNLTSEIKILESLPLKGKPISIVQYSRLNEVSSS